MKPLVSRRPMQPYTEKLLQNSTQAALDAQSRGPTRATHKGISECSLVGAQAAMIRLRRKRVPFWRAMRGMSATESLRRRLSFVKNLMNLVYSNKALID